MSTPNRKRSDGLEMGGDAEKQPSYPNDGSSTLTRENTMSSSGGNDAERHYLYPSLSREKDGQPADDNPYLATESSRNEATQLHDEISIARIERMVSSQQNEMEMRRTTTSKIRSHSPRPNQDVFNQPTPAITTYQILGHESRNRINKFFRSLRRLPRVLRYFFYQLPVTAVLLTPILMGILLPDNQKREYAIGGTDGGVDLLWFGIWLEVVWLSLWAARIVTAILPFIMSVAAKIVGSGNTKKWKAVGYKLELHAALFLWMLAVLISYHPILDHHRVNGHVTNITWIDTVWKIIIALFVIAVLNFVEKILIQWVANSFHLRTYATRIEVNKQSVAYLVHLWTHSQGHIVSEEAVQDASGIASGIRTPMQTFQNNARQLASKVGDVANRVAGDFTGREVRLSNHPRKVVSELLRNSSSACILGRRLFRTYAKPDRDVLVKDDLDPAFPTPEDAEAAFSIFDRDLNGDVSMEELEAFCDEVHREKKAIAASLKDLDSVIQKLDHVFFVVVLLIGVLVFIEIISTESANVLSSAGTTVLGLSWLLSATAQEFLQSIIFVFVKHPFDVGDRVTIYNSNLGASGRGDDYYVTEISLLYTEFKKMEGHIVQAPNSTLNTLFILNHRRSGQLADVFTLRMKHGTPKKLIDELANRMTDFVEENRRDFTSKILTELTTIEDTYCMSVNLICFHKSSYQNELLRLIRHNKFALELSAQMVELGIEQPRRQYQVAGRDFPIYQTDIQPPSTDEGPYPSQKVDSSLLRATRRRAGSRATVSDSTFPDFQEVDHLRKEKSPAFVPPHPTIAEETQAEATASGAQLDRVASAGTGSNSRLGPLFRRATTIHRRSAENQRSNARDMV